MTFTLSELLRDLFLELGQLNSNYASGGTTTSVIDANLAGEGSDDDWVEGCVIILGTTDDGAPAGEFSVIDSFVDNTGTFNLRDTLNAAPGDGDEYGLCSSYFPINTMIRMINAGIKSLGSVPLVDSSLTTVTDQTEYTAAVVWKKRKPLAVEIQNITDNNVNKRWRALSNWKYVPAAAGSTGLIEFDNPLDAGKSLRVWYEDKHPNVKTFDDVILESIHPTLATAASVEAALKWQNSRLGGGDNFLLQRWNDAKNTLFEAKSNYPIYTPTRKATSRFGALKSKAK
jgi:hypothetical protein